MKGMSMWELTVPWWEPVIRGSVIYFVLFVLLRILGKKQIGQPSPFDFILLLIISEAVSNALSGEDNSLLGAIITASTLIALNYFMDSMAFRFPRFEKAMEGEEKLLIRDGRILEEVRKKEEITLSEIKSSLREHGLQNVEDVFIGVLETNGKISIIAKGNAEKGLQKPSEDLI
jgi:uncharacterized membrane protein YcaP (DUF421 family)